MNPIFQISWTILDNTTSSEAFTASANVPRYPATVLNTMKYNAEDWLGYPDKEIVSNISGNYVYQPWRAILTLINQCLTGKTSGSDKPRHPVLQMLWGIITQTNVDHAELLWEEFTQGIQTFFSHKASHKTSLKDPKKKVTPLLIPYGRFSKVIIYYLASKNNIHRRPDSAVHHTGDDFILGNLKFVPKGETVEVFGMAIPDPLITEAIQQSSYYPKYLEMVAENTKKTPQESASVQPATRRTPPKKPTTTTPVKPSKSTPAPTKKPSKHKLPQKVRKGKPTFQLVDEDDEAQQESVPQDEGDDPDLELAKKMSLEAHQEKGEGEGDDADMERAIKLSLDPAFLPQGQAPVGGVTIRDPVSETTPKLPEVVGKGKAIVTEEQVAHSLIDLSKKKRTTDQFILVRRDQTPHDSTTGPSSQPEDDTSEKVIHESSSTSDSERTESETETAAPKGDKDQGEVDSSTVTSGVSIPVSDPEKAHEALAGPDPEPMQEDQTGSNSGKLHVSLAGPNPEHMDDEFLATAYPKVHENLKLITDERVIDDKPESHSGSMSSMKNLDDTFNFGDQFLYDKPTEDDQEKSKVREESDSTIPDPSHQTVTSTPPVIAPFTDVSSSKPSLLVTPPPINTEATTITTSLPEITPFIALQLRVARLEQEMSEVKKTDHSADVVASIKSQVPMASVKIKNLKKSQEIIRAKREQGEEKQDLTYSIRSTNTVDLEEFDLKSALFKHINKIKSANRNTTNYHLYHALMEALIADEDAMDKEVADKVKDHKRKHDSDDDEDDDDDEGPLAGSNQGKSAKRRRHDSGASGSAQPPTKDDEQSSKKPRESDASASKQHPALSSTGWQITDTRDADDRHVLDMEDTDNAHIPKRITGQIHTPTTYKVPKENKLQRKTYDVGSFIKWFCRRTGKKKLCKADLEGDKERKIALSISKLKAVHYLDFGLEELVPSLWVESERDYDISAVLCIHYWWFRRKEFYINKHSEPSDREAVRSQMRILSVISVKVFEKYGYNYLREIILRRADYQEYKISEKDFKNLHPNDFKDLFLLNIQEKLNHLPKTDKTSLHMAVNMWIRNLVIRNPDYYFKEDYTIVPKPRAVVYRDRNDQRKLMRLNELHKFSDGTLTRVMEKLDHMVKDFHLFEYNKGMETRKWSEDDKRRSKDFITAIEKRLQIRRIYRSLESFVGGRIRDIDYRLINRTTDEVLASSLLSSSTTVPSLHALIPHQLSLIISVSVDNGSWLRDNRIIFFEEYAVLIGKAITRLKAGPSKTALSEACNLSCFAAEPIE
ncbi:hypothetical protein Tco_1402179 [Tanacetum coccineum]